MKAAQKNKIKLNSAQKQPASQPANQDPAKDPASQPASQPQCKAETITVPDEVLPPQPEVIVKRMSLDIVKGEAYKPTLDTFNTKLTAGEIADKLKGLVGGAEESRKGYIDACAIALDFGRKAIERGYSVGSWLNGLCDTGKGCKPSVHILPELRWALMVHYGVKNLSQNSLSKVLGCSQSTLSNYLKVFFAIRDGYGNSVEKALSAGCSITALQNRKSTPNAGSGSGVSLLGVPSEPETVTDPALSPEAILKAKDEIAEQAGDTDAVLPELFGVKIPTQEAFRNFMTEVLKAGDASKAGSDEHKLWLGLRDKVKHAYEYHYPKIG